MNAEEHLDRLIPHRLDSLAILVLMLELRLKHEEARPMQILVDGRLQFEGLTSLFMNPIFEIGILHVRALLEFLGLKAAYGSLVAVVSRRPDDAAVEKFSLGPNHLPLVTPAQARAMFPENPALAETCLAATVNAANKGAAHLSTQYANTPLEAEQLLLAARLTQQLVEQYVYRALGRNRPPLPIEARPRSGG